ncbi:MAG: hypothetical protein ACFFD4_38950 [Candidatus Odinarchaeota archaeon]
MLKNPYFSRQKDVLFFGHQRRKLLEDGKWWDIYCDPIIENLDRSYVLVETYHLYRHLTPPKTPNIKYLDFIVFLSYIRRKLRLVRISLTNDEKKLVKSINDEIYSTFNTVYDVEYPIKKMLLIRRNLIPLFKRLLKRIRPRLVIVVVGYNRPVEALTEASKDLNIPVIELQHGVISKYNLGYSFPKLGREKKCFADYLFAFGDFWKKNLEFPIDKDKVPSVGFPYLEKAKNKYSGVLKKNQILFISQGTIGNSLSKFAVELSTNNQSNCNIVYKLHPGEYSRWKEIYPWLKNSNIRVIDTDHPPLHQLFGESKIQIGVSSTAIFEGLYFGLRTYLIDLPDVEHMEDLIKAGIVDVVSSVEDLNRILLKEDESTKIDTETLFRNNAAKHISDMINRLILKE